MSDPQKTFDRLEWIAAILISLAIVAEGWRNYLLPSSRHWFFTSRMQTFNSPRI
jgi:hypothetical protein